MKSFLRYTLIFLLVIVVIGGVALSLVFNAWSRGVLPQHDGMLQVAGLRDTVEVIRDTRGIPHIYAKNSYDLFFAQGYTHAQDRWWQMEWFRKLGSGRLQELTGKSNSLRGTDVFIRTVGWRKSAERDFAIMDDATKASLQAFADGINAYILNRPASQLAFEYNVLGVTGVSIPIEAWTPVDTIVWTKVMSWDLGGNQSEERYLADFYAAIDDVRAEAYIKNYPYGDKTTIIQPEDLPASGQPFAPPPPVTVGRGITGNFGVLSGNFDDSAGFAFARGEGIGSNNWVVSGERTKTGKPLLANDPHLGIQMPSIWYEIGLHCQPVSDECPYNLRGFTFAPGPGIVIGHNDHIAWGVTNVGWDVQDLYAIEVNPDNPLQYKWDGGWRDMTTREEVIRAGDTSETLTITVRETHLGPIINDVRFDDDGNQRGFNNENPIALRWTAYEEGTIMQALRLLNAARNWDEFRYALTFWDAPAQNFVYADQEGNIGYQTPGRMPIRAAGHTGLLPVDGTTSELEWRGFVPYENLPSVFNPKRGYIATANQALVPFEYYAQLAETLADTFGADSHYIFGYFWAAGYRGQRIVDMLEAVEKHDLESFRTILGDNEFTLVKEISPVLSQVDMGNSTLNELRDWMLDWDAQMHMDSPQAALFGLFWQQLVTATFDDELASFDSSANGSGQNMLAIRDLMQEPNHAWWDDVSTEATTETRDNTIATAFKKAYDAAVERMGNDRTKWKWGTLHVANFESNPLGLSGIGLIENMVNRSGFATSGGSEIVNATSWGISSLEVRAVPSMRMVIDLSDLSKSQTIHTTGQSGHPFSDDYANFVDDWRNINFHSTNWTRAQVDSNKRSVLTLTPKP
jgi:penicillin amidase